MKNRFSEEFQKAIIGYFLSSTDGYARAQGIVKGAYFMPEHRKAVRFIQTFSEEYKAIPTFERVKVETGVDYPNMTVGMNTTISQSWLDEVEEFCKFRALELAILAAPEKIEAGKHEEIEKMVKDAILISLDTNMGIEYFMNPTERLNRMKQRDNMTSTGWRSIDQVLYGGLHRGTLTVFAGSSGCVIGSTKVRVTPYLTKADFDRLWDQRCSSSENNAEV